METLKFKIKNVICIPLKSMNDQQLFAVSETYTIAFTALMTFKKCTFDKIWLDKNGDYIIAYQFDDEFIVSKLYCPITKKDRDSILKVKPIKSPKMPKDERSVGAYKYYLSQGFDVKTKSLDRKSDYFEKLNFNIEEVEEIIEETILDIDVILEKISKLGITALSKEEKDFLDNKSKE
jgi:hypothetical protein